MNAKIKSNPLGIFIFISIVIIQCLTACENSKEDIETVTEQFKTAVETIKDMDMIYSESGKVRIQLKSPLSLRHKTENPFVEFPKGLIIHFFNDSLTENSVLSANHGIRYERRQRTVLTDKVVWKNILKQEKLETEELIWDERLKKIYSDKFVKITTPNESIFGQGFETNQEFTNYKIRKITGTVRVKAGEWQE